MKYSIKGVVASLDVDAQQSFTELYPDQLPVPDGHLIAAELNNQAQWADLRIGTKDAHPHNPIWLATEANPPFSALNEPHVDVFWPSHCVPGTPGFELIEQLPHPCDYDFFVWKGIEPDMHPYGACFHDLKNKLSTGLIEFLKQNQVNVLIVGGLALDYCVKDSVLQLLDAGFEVYLNLAACKGLDPESSQKALERMQAKGAILIKDSSELPTRLK